MPRFALACLALALASAMRAHGAQPQDCNCDVMLLLDKSGSIQTNDFSTVTGFAKIVVSDLQKGKKFEGVAPARVGVISFSDDADVDSGLQTGTNAAADLTTKINAIQKTAGTTCMSCAVEKAINEFTKVPARANKCKAIKLLTDGMPDDVQLTTDQVNKAKKAGITIVIVGVSKFVQSKFLKPLVSAPEGKNYIYESSFSGLSSVAHALFDQCSAPQPPDVNTTQRCDCDVMIVLDMSGSISNSEWKFMVSFASIYAHAYRNRLAKGTMRMGLITYSNIVRLEMPLTTDYDIIAAKIKSAPKAGGTTDTAKAIDFAHQELVRHQKKGGNCQTMKLVTDGRSNNYTATVKAAFNAKSKGGIEILAIGVGNNLNVPELKAVASPPIKDNMHILKDFNNLTSLAHKLADVCDDVINGTTPTPAPVDMCHCDLYLVLDSSGSISNAEWDHVKKFTTSMINNLEKYMNKANPPAGVRMSIIEYALTARVDVKESADADALRAAVGSIRTQRGVTMTNLGLDKVKELILNSPTAAQKCKQIKVLTDGRSTFASRTAISAHNLKKAFSHTYITAIGVGNSVDPKELAMIASPGKQYVYNAVPWADLDTLANKLIGKCAKGPAPTPTLVPPASIPTPPNQDFCKCDIMLVLDSSGSIRTADFVKVKDFASVLVSDLKGRLKAQGGSRIGIVRYDTTSTLISPLSHDAKQLQDSILKMPHTRGATFTHLGLGTAHYELSRSTRAVKGGCKLLILVTDGKSNKKAMTTDVATRTKMDGVTIMTVGVGSNTDKAELEEVASKPIADNVKILAGFTGLNSLAHKLGDKCVKGNPTKTPAVPSSYNTCHCDYMLVLDASLSVGTTNYKKMINFARIIVQGLSPNMNANDTRVGVVTYNEKASLRVQMTGDSKSALTQIGNIPIAIDYGTDTAAGLAAGATELTRTSRGLKSCKRVILVTDGYSCCCNGGNHGPKNCPALTLAQAHMMKSKMGIEIFTFGVKGSGNGASGANAKELTTVASTPASKHMRLLKDFDKLSVAAHALTDKCNKSSTPDTFKRDCQCDVALVLDGSGSIRSADWAKVVGFCTHMVKGLASQMQTSDARVTIILFSTKVTVVSKLSDDSAKLEKLCTSMVQPRQTTFTNLGIKEAITQLKAGKRACMAMKVMTDGRSNNPSATETEAKNAKAAGILIYAIGVGKGVNLPELTNIASAPSAQNMRHIVDFSDLPKVADSLVGKCSKKDNTHGSKCSINLMLDCIKTPATGCSMVTAYDNCATKFKCFDLMKIWCSNQFTKYDPYKSCPVTGTLCSAADGKSVCDVTTYSACYAAIIKNRNKYTYCERMNRVIQCSIGAKCLDLVTYRCNHRSATKCPGKLPACANAAPQEYEYDSEFDAQLDEMTQSPASSSLEVVLAVVASVLALAVVALAVKVRQASQRASSHLHAELVEADEE